MKKLLVPMVFVVAGVGSGVGAGLFLRPDAPSGDERAGSGASQGDEGHAAADAHAAADGHGGGDARAKPASRSEPAEAHGDDSRAAGAGHGGGGGDQYVKLGNQFIVPILEESRVRSLVVLSIDLEVGPSGSSAVYQMEPKIRDAFLTVLFDHANAGGFSGAFTSSGAMEVLRRALREAGQKAVGASVVSDVLITGIVRQDV